MKLTPDEERICAEYSKRDSTGKVHCFECPLKIGNPKQWDFRCRKNSVYDPETDDFEYEDIMGGMTMTLDEAIQHWKEVAEEYEAHGIVAERYKCAKDYRQLAEWLEDYKELKADYIELDNLIRKANTENDELKRLLKLAVDDFETAMLEEKCKVCGLEHCDYDEICKWRHHDEAMKLLVAERMPLPEPPKGDAE